MLEDDVAGDEDGVGGGDDDDVVGAVFGGIRRKSFSFRLPPPRSCSPRAGILIKDSMNSDTVEIRSMLPSVDDANEDDDFCCLVIL